MNIYQIFHEKYRLLPATLSILVLGCGIAVAEPFTGIVGQIVTNTGSPVAGYPVIIESQENEDDNFVVLTDDAGVFQVPSLPHGAYAAYPSTQPDMLATFNYEGADFSDNGSYSLWDHFTGQSGVISGAGVPQDVGRFSVEPFGATDSPMALE